MNILLGWSLHDDHICIRAHAIRGAGTSSLGQNRTKMRLPRERPVCTFHVSHVSICVSFWRRCMFVCSEKKDTDQENAVEAVLMLKSDTSIE